MKIINTTGEASSKSIGISIGLAALREQIFTEWAQYTRSTIPEAAQLEDNLLTTDLQEFFDEIAASLGNPESLSCATSAISAHARERATSTAYGTGELLHELQLFRQILFQVVDVNHLLLGPHERASIARMIDAGALQAMRAFEAAHRETGETFIACLAHDLRNPLNVVNASLQLIQSRSIDENILRLARRACANLMNIDEMIGTLLDTTAVNGRKRLRLKITSFDMKALVDEIAADMSLRDNQILSTGEPSSGFWCGSSMKRVIENLLSNAQKHGEAHSPIKIHTEKVHGGLILIVHNKGPAIPEREVPGLFSAFHRLADVDIKGWGLGLPLVQLVVESHGGTVAVSSTAALGTTFTIRLPLDCRVP